MLNRIGCLSAAFLAACAGTTLGSVGTPATNIAPLIINEVFMNPPGGDSNDDVWEYIEISGPAGMSLNNYYIAYITGGADDNDDCDPDSCAARPEIDAFFSLSGKSLSSDASGVGYFVVHNGTTGVAQEAGVFGLGATNKAEFDTIEVGNVNRLQNDYSKTIAIIYCPASGWVTDAFVDVNFDSRLDDGCTSGCEPYRVPDSSSGCSSAVASVDLKPYWVVDEVATSEDGGHEYNKRDESEISETPGFKADALTRVAYYGLSQVKPSGWHTETDETCGGVCTDAAFRLVQNTEADESWVYGDILSIDPLNGNFLLYSQATDDGYKVSRAPTNQSANGFVFSLTGNCFYVDVTGGTIDPEPDCIDAPASNAMGYPSTSASGYKFADHNTLNYQLTPGAANNALGGSFGQVTFLRGDFNLDGVVNTVDENLLVANDGRIVRAPGNEFETFQFLLLLDLDGDGVVEGGAMEDDHAIFDKICPGCSTAPTNTQQPQIEEVLRRLIEMQSQLLFW